MGLEEEKIRIAKIKEIGAVITILISLVTAITAHFQQEKVAQNVYKELSANVKTLSQDQMAMHDDVAKIRGYLVGMQKDNAATALLFAEQSPPAKPTVRLLRPIQIKTDVDQDQKAPSAPKPEPPILKSNPQPYNPPPIESLGK
jgi:hypothetical protein